MNTNLIGLFALFVAYAVHRFIMTEAMKKLEDSDKLRIFETFSKRNNFSTILILSLVFLYFAALEYVPHFIIQTTTIYLILYASYLIFRFVSNYNKLKQIKIPENYIRSFIASYCVFILGFLIMVVCILWDWKL